MRWRSFLLGVFLKTIVLAGVLGIFAIVIDIARVNRVEKKYSKIEYKGESVLRGSRTNDTIKVIK